MARRGHTIPRVDWWCDLATRELESSKVTRAGLAAKISALGYPTTDASVVRCLSGSVLTIELAEHVSAILGIPPSVIIPATEQAAWTMVGRQQVESVRARVRDLREKLTTESNRRPPDPIPAGDEPRRRRVDSRRTRPA